MKPSHAVGAVAAVVVATVLAVVVILAIAGDDEPAAGRTSAGVVATPVEIRGGASESGEGLTDPAFGAEVGLADTRDGGPTPPIATINGPGRRVFSAATVTLPRTSRQYTIRQVLPDDVPAAGSESAFVRWTAYVATLSPAQVRARTIPSALRWTKVGREGVTLPAGATVRLRTLFRVPASAGRCQPGGDLANGRRARMTLSRAPAWLVRTERRRAWSVLKAEERPTESETGGTVVRSGPSSTVTFAGSHECRGRPPAIAVDPDDATLGDGATLTTALETVEQ